MKELVKELKNKVAEIRQHKVKGRGLYREYFRLREVIDVELENCKKKHNYEELKEMANVDASDIFPSKR